MRQTAHQFCHEHLRDVEVTFDMHYFATVFSETDRSYCLQKVWLVSKHSQRPSACPAQHTPLDVEIRDAHWN